MKFEITEEMQKKIQNWDSCESVDVAGAKFSYTFIPTGLGTIVQVKCDICKRTLDLTEDFLI